MAITIDPIAKIIQLDSFYVSATDIWIAYTTWAAESDNLKFGIGMSQLGGVPPVDLYIYLETGYLVRPVEANGVTAITGNLLVRDGSSPIAPTLGNFNVLVNLETPVKASALSTGESVGLTEEQRVQLKELWQLSGLDSTQNMTVSTTARNVGGITLDINTNVDESVTVSRQ